MTAATLISDEQVGAILRDVLTSFAPSDSPAEDVEPSETWIEAFVRLTGAQNGEVTIAMWGSSAAHIAAAMTGRSRDDIDHDDAADALCELANMVGGQVKSLIAVESRLGLPQLRMRRRTGADGEADHAALAASRHRWNGHPIRVTVQLS